MSPRENKGRERPDLAVSPSKLARGFQDHPIVLALLLASAFVATVWSGWQQYQLSGSSRAQSELQARIETQRAELVQASTCVADLERRLSSAADFVQAVRNYEDAQTRVVEQIGSSTPLRIARTELRKRIEGAKRQLAADFPALPDLKDSGKKCDRSLLRYK